MSWSIEQDGAGMKGLLGLLGGKVLFAEDFDLPEKGPPQEEAELIEAGRAR